MIDDNETPTEISDKQNDTFWDKARQTLEECKDESSRFLKLGKLKWDNTSLQKKRSDLLRELGTLTFELAEKEEIKIEALTPLINDIESVNEMIKDQSSEIKEMTKGKILVKEETID